MPRKLRPVTTRLRNRRRHLQVLNILRPFQHIDIQARTHVPRDVAMERPHARIIHVELHNDIPRRAARVSGRQDLHVAALRVVHVRDLPVPRACSRGEDKEVVPVEVHRVESEWDVAVDDEAHGGVGAEVVDVPLRVLRVGDVALVGEEEDWVVEVCAEGLVVHVP